MRCYTVRFASDFFIDLCLVDIDLAVQLRQHEAFISCLTDFDLGPFYPLLFKVFFLAYSFKLPE